MQLTGLSIVFGYRFAIEAEKKWHEPHQRSLIAAAVLSRNQATIPRYGEADGGDLQS
jgi:hypothetical protein